MMIFAALFLTACDSCTPKSKNAENLVLCTSLSYPPYESVGAAGKPVGLDIEMAEAIAENLKKNLVVKDFNTEALFAELQKGSCDIVMAGLSITPEREQSIRLLHYQGESTKTYSLLFWQQAPVALAELEGHAIAVMAGSWMERYLKKQKNLLSKALDTNSDLILELQLHKASAALVEPHIAHELQAKLPGLQTLEQPLPEAEWNYGNGIGIKKDNKELIGKVQTVIAELKSSGFIAALEKKWLTKS
jgi:ABC-type amino acid transport substrate-binding protein